MTKIITIKLINPLQHSPTLGTIISFNLNPVVINQAVIRKNFLFESILKSSNFETYIYWIRAPVAQLDRASDFGSEGWGFESLPACHSALIFGKSIHLITLPLILQIPVTVQIRFRAFYKTNKVFKTSTLIPKSSRCLNIL